MSFWFSKKLIKKKPCFQFGAFERHESYRNISMKWLELPDGSGSQGNNNEWQERNSLIIFRFWRQRTAGVTTPNWQQLSIVNSYPALTNTWASFLWRYRFCVRAAGSCTELVCILHNDSSAVQAAGFLFSLCTIIGCLVLVVSNLTIFINCMNCRSMKFQ